MSSFKYHSPNDFFLNSIVFTFCIMFSTRYWQFSWCWKHSYALTYFQDHYVEAFIHVVLIILQNITTGYISRQWLEFVVGSQGTVRGKVREFFFCQRRGNPEVVSHANYYNDIIMSDDISNHQPHNCLLNRLSRCRSKKTSKLHLTGLCAGNSPMTSEFPAQRASFNLITSSCEVQKKQHPSGKYWQSLLKWGLTT